MKDAGSALMGIGRASGENRAVLAAQQAIESPLIEVSIDGAKGVLFSVAGGYDVTMSEMQEAAELITASVSPDANIIWGASVKPELEDEIVVTVVATGFDSVYYDDTSASSSYSSPVSTDTFNELEQRREDEEVKDESAEKSANIAAGQTSADTPEKNMWDDLKTEDNDMPAILRRKKREK